jgi:hypothetical protein
MNIAGIEIPDHCITEASAVADELVAVQAVLARLLTRASDVMSEIEIQVMRATRLNRTDEQDEAIRQRTGYGRLSDAFGDIHEQTDDGLTLNPEVAEVFEELLGWRQKQT